MKRTMLCLAALASTSVLADPLASRLEVDYGQADLEAENVNQLATDDGRSQRLAGRMVGDDGMLLRFDVRRDNATKDYFGFDDVAGADDIEHRRELASLSIGRTVPLSGGAFLTGELGYARVRYTAEQLIINPLVDPLPGAPLPWIIVEEDRAESGLLARLALDGELGGFTWGVEAEYLDAVPQVEPMQFGLEPDSELWYNARFGYGIGGGWNIGVRYADTDDFTATTLSVRWAR